MLIAAFVIATFSGICLFASSLAFLRAKDVYVMNQILKITNFYIFPLMLIAIEFERFSLISAIKIAAIILINLLTTLLLCHVISRKALTNKISPDIN